MNTGLEDVFCRDFALSGVDSMQLLADEGAH